jgi:hypothetical protein
MVRVAKSSRMTETTRSLLAVSVHVIPPWTPREPRVLARKQERLLLREKVVDGRLKSSIALKSPMRSSSSPALCEARGNVKEGKRTGS